MLSNDDLIEVSLGEDNKLKIHLHGATIISWISNNREILFLSKKAIFDNKKAIRGGIPLCFPNYGPWDNNRPQHGFARIKRWKLKEPVSQESDSVLVKLSLTDDEETRKIWNHNFELIYEITLTRKSLKTFLTVTNAGTNDFDFTFLFHNYFKLDDDISNVKVFYLKDIEYIDKLNKWSKKKELEEFINISEETDRIYICTPNTQVLHFGDSNNNNKSNKFISIQKENLPDTDIWNPWISGAKSMSDFDDNEYKIMLCVQPGILNQRMPLKSTQSVKIGQTIFS